MLKEFEDYLKINVNSERTIKTYLGQMRYFFNKYSEFNQDNINLFLRDLINKNVSENFFNFNLAILRKYAKFLNQSFDFPKPKKINIKCRVSLDRDEIENKILPYFGVIFKDPKKRALIFRFMMLSLLRISEVSNLKKDNINFKTGIIKIVGKGNKERFIVLHKSIAKEFEEEVKKSTTDSALNIPNSYIIDMFRAINKQIGYKKHLTPHVLRRTGAKYLRKSGVEMEALKDIMGHENIQTTYIYTKMSEEEILKEYKKVKYKTGVTK